MRYENIIEILLTRFPQVSKLYEEEGDYIYGLPYLAFEIVFVPFLIKEMQGDSSELKLRLTQFIEEMLNMGDEKTQELAAVSIIEPVVSERIFLKIAKPQFGRETLKHLESYEKAAGWIK